MNKTPFLRMRIVVAMVSFMIGAAIVAAASSAGDASPTVDRDIIQHCTGCDFGHVDWRGADLHGLVFTGDNFDGADLRNADLHGSSFVGDNLSNVKFDGADLRGVSFVGADLAGATFSGAKTDGIRASGVRVTQSLIT